MERLSVPPYTTEAASVEPHFLTTGNHSQYKTNAERGKDCLRRVLANVLLAVVLKTADTMERIIPHCFRTAPIFLGHCARGRAEIFCRLADVCHATLCFFFDLPGNRWALIHLFLVSHRFPFLMTSLSFWC